METIYRKCNKGIRFLRMEYPLDKNLYPCEVLTLVVTARDGYTCPFIRRERSKYVDFVAYEIESDALEWETAFNETVNFLLTTKIK